MKFLFYGSLFTLFMIVENNASEEDIRELFWHSYFGHADTVSQLLKKGAPANGNRQLRPLVPAAGSGHRDIAKTLLESNAEVNALSGYDGESALHAISAQMMYDDKPLETIQLLLDHKADVNLKNNYSKTPLHNAIAFGNLALVKLYLCSGATRETVVDALAEIEELDLDDSEIAQQLNNFLRQHPKD